MSQKGNEIVMQEWAAGEVVESLPARRDVDMAEGILTGLRPCDPNAAYHELLGAAKRNRVGLMAISPALVHVAGIPNTAMTAFEGRAYCAAYREWRDLFDHSRRQASADVTQRHRCSVRVAATKEAMGQANRSTLARQPNFAAWRKPEVPTTRTDIRVKEYQSQFVIATPSELEIYCGAKGIRNPY
jgi:hypothetical protein